MNIFEGLEAFGFTDITEQDLFKKPAKQSSEKAAVVKSIPRAEDYLFQKTYVCPVCDNQFTATTIRKGKLRYVSSHSDLRPCYEPIDPMYYDIVLCTKCGYATTVALFKKITERQCRAIESKTSKRFKPRDYPVVLNTDMAIERYKLALYNALVKEARSGEKAYICLKLAWLYRDKEDRPNENLFLENAYKGFKEAYTADSFPICGIDEPTVAYIVGELARKLGDYSEALKWIGNVIVRKNISTRLKERATEAKDLIRKAMNDASSADKK